MRTLIVIIGLLVGFVYPWVTARADVVTVDWVRVKSVSEASSLCARLMGETGPITERLGCWVRRSGKNTVVAMDSPAGLCTLGHEVKHAIDGRYHLGESATAWNCDQIMRQNIVDEILGR